MKYTDKVSPNFQPKQKQKGTEIYEVHDAL